MSIASNSSDISTNEPNTRKRSASIDQLLMKNETSNVIYTLNPVVNKEGVFHPMTVIGCIDGDGLGLLSWW